MFTKPKGRGRRWRRSRLSRRPGREGKRGGGMGRSIDMVAAVVVRKEEERGRKRGLDGGLDSSSSGGEGCRAGL